SIRSAERPARSRPRRPSSRAALRSRPPSDEPQLRARLARRSRLPRSRNRDMPTGDRKSTRLNSSHVKISYAVFCLKKKTPLSTLGHQHLVYLFEPTPASYTSSLPSASRVAAQRSPEHAGQPTRQPAGSSPTGGRHT